MIKVDVSPRRKNATRPAWKVQKSYHQWLRGRPCAFNSTECSGRMEAAHTPDPRSKGTGIKAADENAIPACQFHHRLHSNKGWSALGLTKETAHEMGKAFWARWRGDKGDLK